MSEGLSRRRVVGGTSPAMGSSATFDSPKTSPPGSSISSRPRDAMAGVSAGSSSGAVEGRGKIAYDPRDFEDGGNEAGKMPRLTIMEEVLLLGLKDKQVSGVKGSASGG